METITSRAFQLSYQRLSEPVVVRANFRTLGTWYPKGCEPEEGLPQVDPRTTDLVEEIRQLKRQLASRPENETALLAQRDEAVESVHVLRRKLEGVGVVNKPASNVRADSFTKFTPVPKPGAKK